jgi:formylglycine-generating enzyme required for sulfatase activity
VIRARPRVAAVLLVALAACRPERPAGMAYVPAGEFLMGSADDDPIVYPFRRADEGPEHPVWVSAFWIDVHEVTNAEYARFKPDHPAHPLAASCDDCPVANVNWFEAVEYCAAQTPPKRLPTEAEWEKAAKAGTSGRFEPLGEWAWYDENCRSAQPVARKRPNAYGLFDMLGNVREWTVDWFDPGYYRTGPRVDPKGPDTGTQRVERGGAFFLPRRGTTATIRYNHPPTIHLYFLGFRCARDV